MHVNLVPLRHTNSPYSSVTSLTHTDSPGAYDRRRGGVASTLRRGRVGLQDMVAGVGSGVGRIWGLRQADVGGRGEGAVRTVLT